MCRPKAPHFSAWAAPKDSTFSTWTAPKDPPFQKYTFVCSTFPTWAALNDPPFKSIRFFVIFSSKTPSIFSKGPLWKPLPHFFCGGRSLSPPFQTLGGTYIYKPLSYMSTPPGPSNKGQFNEFSFVFLSLSVCLSVKQWSFINEFSFLFLSLSVFLSTLF